jgi:hypothetical protein
MPDLDQIKQEKQERGTGMGGSPGPTLGDALGRTPRRRATGRCWPCWATAWVGPGATVAFDPDVTHPGLPCS